MSKETEIQIMVKYLLMSNAGIHTYIHGYLHTYMATYIYAYIRTDIHTYIHAYIHAYIQYCIWLRLIIRYLDIKSYKHVCYTLYVHLYL